MKFIDVQIVTPPATPDVVTIEEYVNHARLNGLTVDVQPELVQRQLDAATQRCELYLRRSLLTQELRALFVPDGKDCSCAREMALPRGPVESVTEIVSNGQPVTGFTLTWNVVTLQAPLTAPTEVTFISAGFGDMGDDVPEPIREGILEYATQLYEDRTGAREPKYAAAAGGSIVPRGIQDLWRPYQLELGG
jgi:uncharacterized phiE125 gp8 family phage protein